LSFSDPHDTSYYADPDGESFVQRPYWVRPSIGRPWGKDGGCAVFGPFQVNWYGKGWRIYWTWPVIRVWHFGGSS